MALSTATKAGLGGLGTVSVGAPTTYFVYDKYFSDSLYEVEREVLEKDLKLAVSNEGDKVTIKAPEFTEENITPKLKVGHKWSCEITVTTSVAGGVANNEATAIQKELTGRFLLLNKKQKTDLVEACSKIKNKASRHEVEGSLKLNVGGSESSKSYKFENNKGIDYLLDFFFKEVEWEVINKNVQLEKEDIQDSSQNKVKIKAPANSNSGNTESNKLAHGHAWSCKITVSTNPSGKESNEVSELKTALNKSLPKLTLENKYKLIKACAGNISQTSLTDTTAARQFTLTIGVTSPAKTYLSSESNIDLGFLTK